MTIRVIPFHDFVDKNQNVSAYVDNAIDAIGAYPQYVLIANSEYYSKTYVAIRHFADEHQIRLYFLNYYTVFVGCLRDAVIFRLGFAQ